jgi:hypothetical protein
MLSRKFLRDADRRISSIIFRLVAEGCEGDPDATHYRKLLDHVREFNDRLLDRGLHRQSAAGESTPTTTTPDVESATVADSPELDELWRKARLLHPTMPERKGKM